MGKIKKKQNIVRAKEPEQTTITYNTITNDIATIIRNKTATTKKFQIKDLTNEIRSLEVIDFPSNGKEWTRSRKIYPKTIVKGSDLWVAGTSKGIWYSEDGKDWIITNISVGNFEKVIYTPNLWVAATSEEGAAGIYTSINGKVWNLEAAIPHTGKIINICYGYLSNFQKGWLVVTSENIYIKIEGGSFSSMPTPGIPSAAAYIEDTFYLGANNSLYTSRDLKTWTPIKEETNPIDGIYYLDNKILLTGTENQVTYSSDFGSTFREMTTTQNLGKIYDIEYSENGAWMFATSTGLFKIKALVSLESYISTPTNKVYYANGKWVSVQKSTKDLYYSLDDGKTWLATNISAVEDLKNADGIWLAASDGSIWYSMSM